MKIFVRSVLIKSFLNNFPYYKSIYKTKSHILNSSSQVLALPKGSSMTYLQFWQTTGRVKGLINYSTSSLALENLYHTSLNCYHMLA